MKTLVFYRCKHCGNVVVKLVDKGVPVFCCGEQMEVLNANTTDAALEKHVPVLESNGSKIKVTVAPDGNMSVEYSQKQADGSFKELGKYQLTKYDSPGSLRGYDFMFEAFNNLTGNKRTISGGDWSGDY